MRKQLANTVYEILKKDKKAVLIFGDVGTYGFRNCMAEFSERTLNVGILEQSMIGMAAGLAMRGLVPIVHTIATFLVERSLEQIKDDFGYQKLGGNFISIGASYDMASWGCTHQCPGDVGILKNVPEIEIVVPGTASEFDSLFKQSYDNGHPTYFRLSGKSNTEGRDVQFGKAKVIKTGQLATVIAVGPMLDRVTEACQDLDVTILYYTTLEPFDRETLKKNIQGSKIIICEPYYSGALAVDVGLAATGRSVETVYIGVPRQFPHVYGTTEDLDKFFHLDTKNIRTRIRKSVIK